MTFLNVLLMIGAILSVVTIDGGRWINLYLRYFSTGETLAGDSSLQGNPVDRSAQSGQQGACVVSPQLVGPDWASTVLIIGEYNASENRPDEIPVICQSQTKNSAGLP